MVRGGTVGGTVGVRSVPVGDDDAPRDLTRDEAWIKGQFSLAAEALRLLPLSALERPGKLRSGMPEIVRSRAEQFAAMVDAESDPALKHHLGREIDRRNAGRSIADRGQLAALDLVSEWLLWLTGDQRTVVMGIAFGRTIAGIARRLRCSRPTVYAIERQVYRLVLDRLAKK